MGHDYDGRFLCICITVHVAHVNAFFFLSLSLFFSSHVVIYFILLEAYFNSYCHLWYMVAQERRQFMLLVVTM